MSEERVADRTVVEEGQLVMPFYLICDVSASMSGDMAALNDGLRRLQGAIVTEPVVDDIAQICVMSFSDTARVLLPLAQMSEAPMPTLAPQASTNYGAAFQLLASTVEHDVKRLKNDGYKPYRACAFFLTDGAPTDRGWHQTFTGTLTYDRQAKRGMKAHPIFVPFGFRDAREDVLKKLAYPPERGKWYLAKNTSVEQALKGILDIIMQTVITTSQTVPAGSPTLALQPPQNPAIVQGDPDYDPDYP